MGSLAAVALDDSPKRGYAGKGGGDPMMMIRLFGRK